jgi:polysaccharide pyruvyl transferase WcaK-like protein
MSVNGISNIPPCAEARSNANRESVIALYGHFGIGNFGNDSTLQAMLCQLRKRLPEATVMCVTSRPELVAAQFGIPAIPIVPSNDSKRAKPMGNGRFMRLLNKWGRRVPHELRCLGKIAHHLRDIDWLIVVGTGAVDDYQVSPIGAPLELLRWCSLARFRRVPIEFVSVGAGPIVHPMSRILMLQALRLANRRSYRDVVSKEYLQRVGFDSRSDPVYPDLAFSLPHEMVAGSRPPSSPPRVVGIGVMAYHGWRSDKTGGEAIYQGYIEKMAQFVTWLLDQGYAVRMLTGTLKSDRRPVENLLAAVATHPAARAGVVVAEIIETIEGVFRNIAATDLVIATRFHNVVYALMLGRPVISLGYAAKNEALLEEMGLAGYSQHIESFEVDRLKEQFQALVKVHAAASQRVAETASHYRELLDQQYDYLFANEVEAHVSQNSSSVTISTSMP